MEGITALLDEKDVMLGAIGHDLKTPLAALRVRIESVEDETERTRMAATIEDIVRTLDDILSLARVGRPRDPLEQSELSALVAAVVEEYEDMGEPVELGETRRIALPLRGVTIRLWPRVNGSSIAAMSASGMPGPSSSMRITACSPSRLSLIHISEPTRPY